jgi:hypothetical protein
VFICIGISNRARVGGRDIGYWKLVGSFFGCGATVFIIVLVVLLTAIHVFKRKS